MFDLLAPLIPSSSEERDWVGLSRINS